MTHRLSQRTFRTAAAVASVGMLAAVAACGGSSDSGDGTIVIGYSAGLSGGAAEYGVNVQNGLKMAIDEVNEEGVEIDGKKYTVKLESLDDQYQPGTTGTNVQRLVEKEGASVVFVPHAGGIKAAQELNSGRTEFLVGAYSSDPAILESGNDLTVMIPPSFDSYVQPFIDKVKTKENAKLGLMATASEFGQEWTKTTIEKWEASGGEVLPKNNIDYGTVSDFAGPVAKTLAGKPDVILVGGPSQPTALLIEEARKQGFKGAFLIIDQAKFEELEEFTDPKNLNNSVGIMPLPLFEGTEKFIADYKEKYSSEKPVNADIALNYQALPIFIEAMKIAGTTDDPKAIREAMGEAVKSVEGVFFVPNKVSAKGHLQADGLQAAYRNADGEYEPFAIEQPQE
ncbi:ABC transporter substrate-binding protein [Aeromicrobium sp. 636]|uniref:ABC transporter substrate-binding protein n=1 Tax=Aeromicrobium senzhongii TaxID=2663859 RepID=A0A8I0JZR1_9ACTN|nr:MULTISPECIES: ABC transporter substrate-binding protein [Aeromicrobium]MBC9224978.1 ABC transporter substrate-binding protein [Aeromicrobium senzhongii]MCQ3997089.1 ABC transporter substrate-binding protein [Aeromicrobium sp. 636]MTB87023.1 ABC transporter substrate-binding protein [Aeromicrobium senzhongii]QNL93156.1 ABC transporter substrate-binding protein [Aeromicrobium senzhongii]